MFEHFTNDTDGIEGSTANLEEIVECAHLLQMEHVGKGIGKQNFKLTFGLYIFRRTLDLGLWQNFAVHLTIRRQRHIA